MNPAFPLALPGEGAVDKDGQAGALLGIEVPPVPFLPESLLQWGIAVCERELAPAQIGVTSSWIHEGSLEEIHSILLTRALRVIVTYFIQR